MSKKKAFITGITGQDGSYLSEYLLNLGYEVHGLMRRQSVSENQSSRIESIHNDINTYYGDMTDETSLFRLLSTIQPDEVYNLAAMSHVRISFDVPSFTAQVNSIGALNMLETIRNVCPDTKFYQASSSEMFGNSVDDDGYQRLTTPMTPVSPYGCAKLYAYNITNVYRDAYNLHASNGILFNHESPRRGANFITNKVVKTAVEIKKGLRENLVIGNLDSYRDWGHSRDYVKAMHSIVNNSFSDNWIVSTGQAKSVRYLCDYVFSELKMSYKDFVTEDEKYKRPNELTYLKGDNSKIHQKLGWVPEYTFETMIDEMIDYWLSTYNKKHIYI
jgi:GDPmannose 4,6-dehydratase